MRSAAGALVTVALLCGAARAQVGTNVTRAPTLTVERYPEDWSHLADPAARTGHWTERLKYIPLNDTGTAFVTTGLEERVRYEGFVNPLWGSAPDDDYLWYRLLPYADLHVWKVRLFAQPMASAILGTDRAKLPVDTTAIDVLQAFVEIGLPVTEDVSVRVTAGRRLVSLGAGRFIDTRYGPNVPLAFDGFETALLGRTRQVRLSYQRPVDTRSDYFDDRTSRRQSVWAAYATQWLGGGRATGVDLYYLGFHDRNAVFDQGAGRLLIHTMGTRLFGEIAGFYWNLEAALQLGTFAGHRVLSGGAGGEVGHRFARAPLAPEISLLADCITGDDNPDDGTLNTFHPMFPRGKYFSAQSPIGPRNLVHLQPSVAVHPIQGLTFSVTGVAYWRESTRDGIYAIPGVLVRSGKTSRARHIGEQVDLAAAWQATQELNVSASVSAFVPGRFIEETGPSKTIRIVGAQATFRF